MFGLKDQRWCYGIVVKRLSDYQTRFGEFGESAYLLIMIYLDLSRQGCLICGMIPGV